MKQLILVRYGQYKEGHLTEEGVETMMRAGEKVQPFISGRSVRLLAAETPRAIESAEVIGEMINKSVEVYSELYAAEEDEKLPDCELAENLLVELGHNCDVLVAIVSREYIETLPSYLLKKDLKTSLERGDCLVIDFDTNGISYLKSTNL
jgi:phosphohistidine phosphatase SixA